MPSAYDVPADKLILRIAEELKNNPNIQPPEWALYSKTGVHKENIPVQKDWWYIRAASILRKIYLKGPIGVSRLRVIYGGKHRRGVRREHFAKGSGSIIRKIIQQLEKANYIQKKTDHLKKGKAIYGRIISPEGQSFVDRISAEIKREIPALERY
ncbi:MAG: 30S ribosomal protein S19e [Candidatus Heimdallarchaeum endolithica]|uniref:Small ribosomal subunit protein eS19 n=1 Tax=Candidatus Heimdallarchaeum endolithica TaxID=2876572 RepID=A0A9Y1BQR9_9ARCH|nr:MAG: 30S ribosomal protein S19e [Candidatus Heimdallarchaeum endolithica]